MKNKIEQAVLYNANSVFENSLVEFVKQVVGKYYDVDPKLLEIKTRKREVVLARQVCMYLIVKNSKISLKMIGNYFNKDHATVIHSNTVIKNYLDWDKDLRTQVEELQNVIRLKGKATMEGFSLDNDFYYIDLNNYSSFKTESRKSIILAGYTTEEIEEFKNRNGISVIERKHENTGMYVLDKQQQNEKDKN